MVRLIFIISTVFVTIASSSSLRAEQNDPIKIGIICSLDPLVAPWSQSANIGLQKAAAEINAEGGIKGRKLVLIFEDDRFLAKNALTAYQKLKNVDEVDFIIGPQFDQTVAPVRHLANKDKKLIIQTIGTNPVNEIKNGYIIHAYPSDKFAGRALAKRIMQDKRKKISFLIPEESYSQNLAKFVKQNLSGVEYQWINYEADINDYKPILLKAKSYEPEALVFFFLMPDVAAHIYKTMRQLSINLPIYTSESLHAHEQFISEAGEIADPTTYFVLNFDENTPKIKKFLQSLPEKPTLPSYAVVGYDTLKWLASLVEKHGTDNSLVKDAIYKMKYKGLFTTYQFDETGDHPKADYVAWHVTKDGYVRERG